MTQTLPNMLKKTFLEGKIVRFNVLRVAFCHYNLTFVTLNVFGKHEITFLIIKMTRYLLSKM